MKMIAANSKQQLESVLSTVDIYMPLRTEKQTTVDCERWSICHWLSTLNHVSKLSFPLQVAKREKPDFQICPNETAWGVEITEAIPTDYAKANALAEKENPDAVIDISLFKFGEIKTLREIGGIISQRKLIGPGWAGDSEERELAEAIRTIVPLKTEKL